MSGDNEKLKEEVDFSEYAKTFLKNFKVTSSVSRLEDLKVFDCGKEQCLKEKVVLKAAKPYYLFHYVEAGNGFFIQNGKKHRVKAGQMFVAFPQYYIEYYPDKNQPWLYQWFSAGGREAENLVKSAGIVVDNPVITVNKNGNVRENVTKLVDMYYDNGKINLGVIAYLYLIFNELIGENEKNPSERYCNHYINEAITFMDYNYQLPITIGNISDSVGISTSYLNSLFAQTVKMSPKQYLTNMRMGLAINMLNGDKKSKINEIAPLIGYKDSLHFSREFKKHFGISPRNFVKTN